MTHSVLPSCIEAYLASAERKTQSGKRVFFFSTPPPKGVGGEGSEREESCVLYVLFKFCTLKVVAK